MGKRFEVTAESILSETSLGIDPVGQREIDTYKGALYGNQLRLTALNTRKQRTNTCRPLNVVWLKPKISHHTEQKQANTFG